MDKDKDNLKFHPTSVPGVGVGNHELGRQIARMRYDQLGNVLSGLSLDLEKQAAADFARGRPQLAKLLRSAKIELDAVGSIVEKMFRLSRPYMEHEFAAENKEAEKKVKSTPTTR